MIPIASTLVADPPWRFGDRLPGASRGAEKNYSVLTTEDLCALRIPPVENDALLFLWRVSAMQQDALDVVRAWGFEPMSEIVWIKLTKGAAERRLRQPFTIPAGLSEAEAVELVFEHVASLQFGMGRYVRHSHETCLIAARGRGKDLIRHLTQRSVFFAPVGEHSEKPEKFFRIVEGLSKPPFVELFARKKRPGWTCLGDEIGFKLEVGSPRPRRVR